MNSEFVICPYEESHRIRRSNFLKHKARCQRNNGYEPPRLCWYGCGDEAGEHDCPEEMKTTAAITNTSEKKPTTTKSDFLVCPFDDSHRVRRTKFINHFVKCRRNHRNLSPKLCMYGCGEPSGDHDCPEKKTTTETVTTTPTNTPRSLQVTPNGILT